MKKRIVYSAMFLLALATPVPARQGGPRSGSRPSPISNLRAQARAPMMIGSRSGRSRGGNRANPSDETLLLACEYLGSRRGGDPPSEQARRAWEEFYSWCDASIRRFAGTYRGRGVDVDDCAQEVWVDLLSSLADFKPDDSRGRLSSWLYAIVRSKAMDAVRLGGRRRCESLSDSTAMALGTRETDPAKLWEEKSDQQSVQQAMLKLRERSSEQNYQLLHLRFMEGRRVGEVADALGLTSQQVWAREHRMKRKLRELLV